MKTLRYCLLLYACWLGLGPGLLPGQAQAVPGFDRAVVYGQPAPGANPTRLYANYFTYYASVVDPQGNRYLLGRVTDSVALGRLVTPAAIGGLRWCNVLAKYSAAGAWEWLEILPQSGELTALARDAQGFLYLTGDINGNYNLGPGRLSTPPGTYDVVVAKFDPATRTWPWVVQGGGSNGSDECSGQAVVVAPTGALYVAGAYTGTTTRLGSLVLTRPVPIQQGNPSSIVFLSRLDPATGTWLWASQANGIGTSVALQGLAADSSGAYLAGNCSWNFAGFGPHALANPLPEPATTDAYVAKAAAATGAWLWATATQSTNPATPWRPGQPGGTNCSALRCAGPWVYAAGASNALAVRLGTTALANAGGTYQTNGQPVGVPIFTVRQTDAWVARLSAATGAWGWAVGAGGLASEAATSLALAPGGNVLYTGGTVLNTVPGAGPLQVGSASAVGPAAGSVFLTGLDTATGAGRWAVQAGGPRYSNTLSYPFSNYTNNGTFVDADGQGRLLVAATFQEEPAAFAPLAPAPTGLPALRTKHILARLAGGPLAVVRPAPAGAESWAAYPNPLPGGARALRLAGLPPGTPVRVADALGRAVAQGRAGAAPLALPATLAPGLYLVQAQGQARRLVVE